MVGHRHGSDLALLWLWGGLAAVAPIRSLVWEPPYASGVAQKAKTKKKKEVTTFFFYFFFFFFPGNTKKTRKEKKGDEERLFSVPEVLKGQNKTQ